ncbi:MAG TPA: ABC transporter permease, partial [Chloroflexi bacterium]|nr:ABC transporter permease [Chloroflexota bacterium]
MKGSELARRMRPLLESVVTILLGLLAGALFMIVFGYNPVNAYQALFKGAFGSMSDVLETLAFATPLMLTAITFAIGVKTGLFNIGAEGQVYMGAIGATAIAGKMALPPGLHVAAATIVGMLMGVLWALPPALLKIWRGVHEVISTIMFNWIAFHLSMYIAIYYLAEPGRAERTVPAMPTARYPILMEGTSLTAVIFVVLAFCVGVYIYLWGTRAGYELRLAGENPDAARYAGVSSNRALLLSFLIGGLAAGLAGASQVIGRPPSWSLYATLGNVAGFGFDGLGVALIGRNHPIGGIFAAILFGALQHGGRYMEYHAGVCS